MSDKLILSVYFSGTSHSLEDRYLLASVLNRQTAFDETHQTMAFNGCGVDYGMKGVIFGTGLEEQCQSVFNFVIKQLKLGKRIRLNAYGHSRGAIACLMLAKMLGHFDVDLVEVNLALMDPVPGNSITSSTLDFTHRTLANQTMDVSQCRNLVNVLAIYPHIPLPSIAFHAPLIPTYPVNCEVTEEIVPGCHAGAQFVDTQKIQGHNRGSEITLILVSRFLAKLGTVLNFLNPLNGRYSHEDYDDRLLGAYVKSLHTQEDKAVKTNVNHLSRACHGKSSVRIETNWPAKYLSSTHKNLHLKHLETISPQEKLPEKKYQREFAYSFAPASKRNSKVAPLEHTSVQDLKDTTDLFIKFLEEIYISGLSTKSRESTKGKIFKKSIETLLLNMQTIQNEASLKDAMRNSLGLCLQRDRFSLSLFSTTRSGNKAESLLNSDKYRALGKMILNGAPTNVHYRDLRAFVLGRNDKAYFNAKHAGSMYQFFQTESKQDIESAVEEKPVFLANNVKRFVL